MSIRAFVGCGGRASSANVLLRLEGESSARLELSFGTVEAGVRHERAVELVNAGEMPVRVVSARAITSSLNPERSSPFSLEELFPLELAPGAARSLQVGFEPKRSDASYSGAFQFTLDGTPSDGPLLVLSGKSAKAKCALELDVASLDFGIASTEERSARSLTIRNAATVVGADCEVELRLDPDGDKRFRIETPPGPERLGPGETRQVTVTVMPGEPMEAIAITGLRILADGELFAEVPVRAEFPSCLVIEPAAINFGTVDACTSQIELLTLRNSCAGALTIDAVQVTVPASIGVGHPRCQGTEPCPRFSIADPSSTPTQLAGETAGTADDGRLLQASLETGGSTSDICDLPWDNLNALAVGNCGPVRTMFQLSDQPVIEDGFTVTINGASVPAVDANNKVLWWYDAKSNAIVFAHAPGVEKVIEVTFHRASCGP